MKLIVLTLAILLLSNACTRPLELGFGPSGNNNDGGADTESDTESGTETNTDVPDSGNPSDGSTGQNDGGVTD